MGTLCYMCPQWNDWLERCDAPFWCPDKETVNTFYDTIFSENLIPDSESSNFTI